MNPSLAQHGEKSLLDDTKTFRKLELNYRRNRAQDNTATIDQLASGFAFEDSMADLRRLDHPVARLEPERFTLVLIDDPDPAPDAADHLELDLVVMNIILRLAAAGNANVRGDETPAEPARNQIAVFHASPPHIPCAICGVQAADYESPLRRINRNVRHKIR